MFMNTYFCIVCGRYTNQYDRCPSCGADKQSFMFINNSANKNDRMSFRKDFKKDLRQRLFALRLNRYLS